MAGKELCQVLMKWLTAMLAVSLAAGYLPQEVQDLEYEIDALLGSVDADTRALLLSQLAAPAFPADRPDRGGLIAAKRKGSASTMCMWKVCPPSPGVADILWHMVNKKSAKVIRAEPESSVALHPASLAASRARLMEQHVRALKTTKKRSVSRVNKKDATRVCIWKMCPPSPSTWEERRR